MSILETLSEGVKQRSMKEEGSKLVAKWEKYGLLEGLKDDVARNNMAVLLENEVVALNEATSMGAGDVEGFASVAFPIVRRVFAKLIANDIVSVQPMSLPSGLIFFMDFTLEHSRLGFTAGESVYGGGVVGSQVTGGVSLGGANAEKGFYNLNQGYTSPTGSATAATMVIASGTVGVGVSGTVGLTFPVQSADGDVTFPNEQSLFDYLTRFDPDLSGSAVALATISKSSLSNLNTDNLIAINHSTAPTDGRLVRRLTQESPFSESDLVVVVAASGSEGADTLSSSADNLSTWVFPIVDNFVTGGAIGSVVGSDPWAFEGADDTAGSFDGYAKDYIPEINIKVDSVPVTAFPKKYKAKWTPEVGQDLNAYHNLDAEQELTKMLSEQIALEIDREILYDLIQGAEAGRYFWSQAAGKFVNPLTGQQIGAATAAPDFTGNVSEWFETLVKTINDVSAQIHRKVLRGGANFLVVSPEVANILEFTAGFRANITADSDRGTVGAVNVGSLSRKYDVYVDPYFPRNVVLVGRKGSNFLESGYVYAPYIPLQVTPTILGPEDFLPRKGVMTRYAKKMVKPDMYGLVVVTDMP